MCTNLSKINIPANVRKIGKSAFCGCIQLQDISIPSQITTIEKYTFANCPITSINIPQGIINIEEGVFEGCNQLTTITIPESVISIGYGVFSGCSKLESIKLESKIPPQVGGDIGFYTKKQSGIMNPTYYYVYEGPTRIYVPSTAIGAYKNAEEWKKYAEYYVGY